MCTTYTTRKDKNKNRMLQYHEKHAFIFMRGDTRRTTMNEEIELCFV